MTRPARNLDLHGNVPEKSTVALLLIDVINDFNFEGGPALLKRARVLASRVARLKARARRLGIPAVYVNDNFGRWRSDFRQLVDHCRRPGGRGKPVADVLRPKSDDYFILKPKHSGFFATALDTLLTYLGVDTLILVGLTTDNCVLFTASDAYLRDFHLCIPIDCVAAIEDRHGRQALRHVERVLHADTRGSDQLDLRLLLGDEPVPSGRDRAIAGIGDCAGRASAPQGGGAGSGRVQNGGGWEREGPERRRRYEGDRTERCRRHRW